MLLRAFGKLLGKRDVDITIGDKVDPGKFIEVKHWLPSVVEPCGFKSRQGCYQCSRPAESVKPLTLFTPLLGVQEPGRGGDAAVRLCPLQQVRPGREGQDAGAELR